MYGFGDWKDLAFEAEQNASDSYYLWLEQNDLDEDSPEGSFEAFLEYEEEAYADYMIP